ncbi:hypothetical protein BJ684DRAFT_21178 [Piptocephalis cylindrospora]|uniref:Transmembrane protein 186 n=1 Tax=Piptocephalis cylindrospora TaxID=1907219 RepID=A0A4P9Y0K6_9FUNG|nr:hypothetical protein BJ684DRAFT_21178 [Piptocephalis cylindrospora]|eukprot:RKP12268.1 hypothetical protein BJ684DRAFT_21178 [Piptocephalis cylindrospora]
MSFAHQVPGMTRQGRGIFVRLRGYPTPVHVHGYRLGVTRVYSRTPASVLDAGAFRAFSQSISPMAPPVSKAPGPEKTEGRMIYMGPLAKTARYLKVFSVSSLSLTFGALPLIFFVDAELTMAFRTALAGAALFTSASSTFLIHYAMHPYVLRISLPDAAPPSASDDAGEYQAVSITPNTQLAVTTLSFWAKPIMTRLAVKDIHPSSRVFSSWRTSSVQGRTGKPLFVHPGLSQTPEMNQLVEAVASSGSASES